MSTAQSSPHRRGVEVIKHVVVDAGVDVAAALPGPGGKLQHVAALTADGHDSEQLTGKRRQEQGAGRAASQQRAEGGGRRHAVHARRARTHNHILSISPTMVSSTS